MTSWAGSSSGGRAERPIPADMDFGYAVLPEHRRQGVATSALRIVLEHCFGELALHRVYGECARANPASARVMTNAGMRPIQSSAADQQGFILQSGVQRSRANSSPVPGVEVIRPPRNTESAAFKLLAASGR